MADVALARRWKPVRIFESGRRLTTWTVAGMVAVLVTVLVVAVVAVGRPEPAPEGLPDAGVLTGWALPLVRALMELFAVGTIGMLLCAAFLLPASAGVLGLAGGRVLRLAGRWAWGWLACSSTMVVLVTSDVVGVPIGDVLGSSALLRYGWQLPEGRALVAMTLAALVVALNARAVRGRHGSLGLLLVGVLAMVPLLLTGHSASAGDHYLATQALLVHVLAATLWVGGLLGLITVARTNRSDLPVAVPRFSSLALVCFAAVAASGAVTAWTRLGFGTDGWASTYGALVAVKTGALVALGVVGLVHRRRTVAGVLAGRQRPFVRLAVVEVLLMSATVAVAVVLSRTAPPAGEGLSAGSAHGESVTTVDRTIDPFTLGGLVTQWRPDALVVTAVAVSVLGYLLAARAVRRGGGDWPLSRTGWGMAGLGVVLFALCGGLGAYGSAMLSVQAGQLLTMSVLAPYLLVRAEPVRLLRTVTGTVGGPPPRWLTDPVNAVTALAALWLLVYASPLLDASLSTGVVHLLVNVAALVVGTWVWSALRSRGAWAAARSQGDRAVVALVPAVMLTVLAIALWRAEGGFGRFWFESLHLFWDDPVGDRRYAVLVMLGFAVPFVLLAARSTTRPSHTPTTPTVPVETRENSR